jgi:hypothetical protein
MAEELSKNFETLQLHAGKHTPVVSEEQDSQQETLFQATLQIAQPTLALSQSMQPLYAITPDTHMQHRSAELTLSVLHFQ